MAEVTVFVVDSLGEGAIDVCENSSAVKEQYPDVRWVWQNADELVGEPADPQRRSLSATRFVVKKAWTPRG